MGKKRRSKKSVSKTSDKGSVGAQPKAAPPKEVSAGAFRQLLSREWVQVALVLLWGFLLRLWNVLEMRANSPFFDLPATDSQHFDNLAKVIAAGDWLGSDVFYYNPLYPYFLGSLYALFGPNYLLVKVIQSLFGCASCLLIYIIAKRVTTQRAALIAALAAASYAIFIFHEELLLTAVLSMFAMLLSIWLLLRFKESPTLLRSAVAGISLGFAFVARPTFFPFIATVWLVVAFWKRGIPFLISRLAVFGVAATLMVIPVTIRNYVVGDDLVLIAAHTGYNVYLGNNPESSGYLSMPSAIPRTLVDNPTDQRQWFKETAEKDLGRELKPSEVSQYWSAKGWAYITGHPGEWLGKVWDRLVRIANEYEFSDNQNYYFSQQFSTVLRLPLLVYGVVLPFALLGMVVAFRKRRKFSLLYLFVAGYTVGLLGFFINARYRMLMVPLLIIFAAHGLYWLGMKLREKEMKPAVKGIALLAVFFAVSHVNLGKAGSKSAHYIDYYNLANKYSAKERFEEAIAAYRKSIAMNPNYLSSHNNLASVLEKSGQYEAARDKWQDVLKMAERKGSPLHIERARKHLAFVSQKLTPSDKNISKR